MSLKSLLRRYTLFGLFAGAVVALLGTTVVLQAQQQASDDVLKAEAERVAVVAKVMPTVVAVFGPGGKGGGSGVLISDDGFALTNFHVTAGSGAVCQCGLADGILYDAVLVGQDKVGDVSLIKLFQPKGKENQKFPFAPMGDSDKCREGDWSFAMGNPFLLATDFTPTVTYGLISGVHRYQYPSGVMLEYTDCIQIDTSINPGNSGGPLFNVHGEVIGINGRGSFDKRPRINSGVGYAISINQIKNFLGHLHAGLDVDHATPGFAVTTQTGRDGFGRMEVTQLLRSADVARRGLQFGDELVSFDGRPIFSVNHFKNVLGLFPRGWRVPMEFRVGTARDDDEAGARKDILIRLMGVQRKVIADPDDPNPPKDGPPPKGPPQPKGAPNSPVAKYYVAKEGFANYYYNKEQTDALIKNLNKHGDFAKLTGNWELEGSIKFKLAGTGSDFKLEIAEEMAKAGTGKEAIVRMKLANKAITEELRPNLPQQRHDDYLVPQYSGGFLAAMHLYRELLVKGPKAFGDFAHGGHEPFYPPAVDRKKSFKDRKVMGEVASGKNGAYAVKFYFHDPADADKAGRLEFMEVRISDDDDPCEVYFSNYKQVEGRWLPHTMTVYYADSVYGTIELSSIKMN
jgi:S1-C subfamily serine protease